MNRERAMAMAKKLLRLSRSPNAHEAESAREMAAELMVRYRIDPSVVIDEETERRPVPEVDGTFWREQLLVAVADLYRCDLVRDHDGQQKLAVLVGERPFVEAAEAHYHHLRAQVERLVVLDWQRFSALPEMLRKLCRPVFFRSYCNALVLALAKRLRPDGYASSNVYSAEFDPDTIPAPTGRRPKAEEGEAEKSDEEKEIDRLDQELDELESMVDSETAARIQALSSEAGHEAARRLQLPLREGLTLAAESSWLPPTRLRPGSWLSDYGERARSVPITSPPIRFIPRP